MPTKRFENLDQVRKNKILDSARQEFIKHGYEDTSLNEIVRGAEISKGSLYYYFEDKTDLYLTVMDEIIKKMIEEVGGIIAGEFSDDFWGDFEDMFKKNIQYILRNPDMIRLSREFKYLLTSPRLSGVVKAFYEKYRGKFAEIFRRGQEMGAVRTDLPLELLVNILTHMDEGIDMWVIERGETMTPDEINRIYMTYVDICKKIACPES